MNTLYTAKVTVRSGRDGSIRSDDGLLDSRLAFPKALGGDGRGTIRSSSSPRATRPASRAR